MTARLVRFVVLGGLIVAFPWLPGVASRPVLVQSANLAGETALVAMSLVLLTGWVGQISLGQGAFVGIGAFTTGLLARKTGIPFPVNLPIVALVTAAVAALLGVVALRVRGLYLAVATLIFAYMADKFLFASAWLVGEGGGSSIPNRVIGRPETVTFFDFRNKSVFYLVVVAAVAAVWYAAVNLRDSKTGRAFFAVRGSETAAVSLGIDVTRYKLLAFALSGAVAGIAGTLIMTDLRTAIPVDFQFTTSLLYLGVAVVGGVGSLGGAVAASMLFAFLNSARELWSGLGFVTENLDIIQVSLLLGVLLAYPGGLGALGPALASHRRRRAELAPRESDVTRVELPQPAPASVPPDRADRVPLLEARDVTVRFGGLTAVRGVSLTVAEREIVGLIGPNGAGKTTMFNAIGGLNEPSTGTIRLFGTDVTRMPVHVRAQMGVGRTFQLIQLFPQLSVFDNLLVATHVHNPTGVLRHVAVTDRAIAAERDARATVQRIVELLSLGDVAGRRVAGLPFGIMRRVELARALVTQAPLLMLDEPVSGLDNAETDEFANLLRFIRAELGVGILLIEHDVRMVTGVCDHIYVIDQGRPLADGTPAEISRNAAVIAAYLGEPIDTEPVHA